MRPNSENPATKPAMIDASCKSDIPFFAGDSLLRTDILLSLFLQKNLNATEVRPDFLSFCGSQLCNRPRVDLTFSAIDQSNLMRKII